MNFIGKFKDGLFIPGKPFLNSYNEYKRLLEEKGVTVSIDIKTSNITTQSQINYLNMVIRMAAEKTGNSYKDIIEVLKPITPVEFAMGGFRHKDVMNMDRTELSLFIEASVMYLNEFLDLKLKTIDFNEQT